MQVILKNILTINQYIVVILLFMALGILFVRLCDKFSFYLKNKIESDTVVNFIAIAASCEVLAILLCILDACFKLFK